MKTDIRILQDTDLEKLEQTVSDMITIDGWEIQSHTTNSALVPVQSALASQQTLSLVISHSFVMVKTYL